MENQVSPQQIAYAQSEYDDKAKSGAVMWILWLFTGVVGGHRYYLGNTGRGVAMTLTLGGLGFWTLIDAFFIGNRRQFVNSQVRQEVFTRYGIS